MRYLFEIYVTAWEWIQDRRGAAAAHKAQQKPDSKTIWTFLSQGAVGGAIGYFLLLLSVLEIYQSSWSLLHLFTLPIMLFLGAGLGAVVAGFVWLGSVLLKRKLGFVARALLVTGATTLLSLLFSYQFDLSPTEQQVALTVGFACVLELPIVLLTGSSIRPCHMLFLGAAERRARPDFSSWLSYVAGFLLRVVSIFGLFETALLLALCIFATPKESLELASPEFVVAIVLAVFYFPISVYLSFKTPRKGLVLPATFFLNVPLVAWILRLANVATEASVLLAYALLVLLCLWAAYAVAIMIAPAPVQPAIKSWRETMAPRIFPIKSECQVRR